MRCPVPEFGILPLGLATKDRKRENAILRLLENDAIFRWISSTEALGVEVLSLCNMISSNSCGIGHLGIFCYSFRFLCAWLTGVSLLVSCPFLAKPFPSFSSSSLQLLKRRPLGVVTCCCSGAGRRAPLTITFAQLGVTADPSIVVGSWKSPASLCPMNFSTRKY